MDNSLLDDNLLDDSFGYLSEEEENWQLFLGDKANHYIPIWKRIKQGQKVHFNIFPFLFSLFWVGYKKMYGLYFLLLIMYTLLELVPFVVGINTETSLFVVFDTIVSWGCCIGLSLWGNSLYYNHSIKKIQEIKRQELAPQKKERELAEAGNNDLVFPIITFIIYIIVIICLVGT